MSDINWINVTQQIGIPFAIICALGLGIWRIMRWLAPRFDKALKAHLELVHQTSEASRATTQNVKEIRGLLEASHNKYKELHREVVEHRAKMERES
ncbi:MAG: hypothetical protein MPJ50_05075 [Pirellulales bacterium]|nr:hypothetical protein [Pirellulales bacterium]